MKRLLRILLPALLALLIALLPTAASAHPLGNFSINRYSRLELQAGRIVLLYIVDMAEIPAFQERSRIDLNADGQLSPAEEQRFLDTFVPQLRQNLQLTLDRTPLLLEAAPPQLEFPSGQGGLPTLRLTLQLSAPLPADQASYAIDYRDNNFAERPGWQEVIVRAGNGVRLLESSVPQTDLSTELRSYPQELLQSPLQVNAAQLRVEVLPGALPAELDTGALPLPAPERQTDQFAELLATPLQPLALLGGLGLAFVLGAAHALSPGHGKTIVAAYLVGSRGTTWHAIFLGLTTTITHTLGVFLLGLLTLFVSAYVLPEQLYPWLSLISGLLVCGLGFTLFSGRLRLLRRPASAQHDHTHGPHDHAQHHHDHDHDHDHALEPHSHGFGTHSHAPIEPRSVSWRGLLALGISGGLLPCPSALVLLLASIALGRTALGLVLVTAFSLGLAAVLSGIGILLVHARRLFDHIPVRGRLFRLLPLASAAVICIAGAGITLQALSQTGLLRL